MADDTITQVLLVSLVAVLLIATLIWHAVHGTLDSRPVHIAILVSLLAIAAALAGCAEASDDRRRVVSSGSCLGTRYATSCRTRSGAYESETRCWHGGGLTTCRSETTRRVLP